MFRKINQLFIKDVGGGSQQRAQREVHKLEKFQWPANGSKHYLVFKCNPFMSWFKCKQRKGQPQ